MFAHSSKGAYAYVHAIACFLFFLVLLWPNSVAAQEVIAVQGGIEKSDDLYISWTIGEPIIHTITQDEIILTQGFQQPFTVSERIKLDDAVEMIEATLFPNPTTGELTLKIEDENPDFTIEILNLLGERIDYSTHTQDVLNLDLSGFTSGVYFFRIRDNSINRVAVFKVEKL